MTKTYYHCNLIYLCHSTGDQASNKKPKDKWLEIEIYNRNLTPDSELCVLKTDTTSFFQLSNIFLEIGNMLAAVYTPKE